MIPMSVAPYFTSIIVRYGMRFRRVRHSGALVFLALTISLLNPLLCVWHCVVLEPALSRGHFTSFICHFGGAPRIAPQAETTVAAVRSAPPRAFYEGAVAPFALLLIPLPAALLPAITSQRRYSEPLPPLLPPPKRFA